MNTFLSGTSQQIWSTDRIPYLTASWKNGANHGGASPTFFSAINPGWLPRMQIVAFQVINYCFHKLSAMQFSVAKKVFQCSPPAQVSQDHALPLFLEKGGRNSPFPHWGLENNFMPPFRMPQRPKQPLQLLGDPCFPFPPKNRRRGTKILNSRALWNLLVFYLPRNKAGCCEGGIDRSLFKKQEPLGHLRILF